MPDEESAGQERETRFVETLLCSICTNQMTNAVAVVPCMHHFCEECIATWHRDNTTCPNCRESMIGRYRSRIIDELLAEVDKVETATSAVAHHLADLLIDNTESNNLQQALDASLETQSEEVAQREQRMREAEMDEYQVAEIDRRSVERAAYEREEEQRRTDERQHWTEQETARRNTEREKYEKGEEERRQRERDAWNEQETCRRSTEKDTYERDEEARRHREKMEWQVAEMARRIEQLQQSPATAAVVEQPTREENTLIEDNGQPAVAEQVEQTAEAQPATQLQRPQPIEQQQQQPQQQPQQRAMTRCAMWPHCPHGMQCAFIHPSQPCKLQSMCPSPATCLFLHPCMDGLGCRTEGCPLIHPRQKQRKTGPKIKKAQQRQPKQCRFGAKCCLEDCRFSHPAVSVHEKTIFKLLPSNMKH